jgi:hypothetical protein
MKSYLSVLAISALMLTGCASPNNESQPEYDAVDLLEYQMCLELRLRNSEPFLANGQLQVARKDCQAYKPIKR